MVFYILSLLINGTTANVFVPINIPCSRKDIAFMKHVLNTLKGFQETI